jgi:flagellar biosynthetic protein FlhB
MYAGKQRSGTNRKSNSQAKVAGKKKRAGRPKQRDSVYSDFIGGVYQNLDTLRLNTTSDVNAFSVNIFKKLFSILIPFFLPILIAGAVGNIGQIGFEIHGEPLRPKLAKLNPISGVKRLFSLKALVDLAKSIIKILIIGGIAYGFIKSQMEGFPPLMQQGVGQILLFIAQAAFKILFLVCLALILLAFLDFIYQRWQHG